MQLRRVASPGSRLGKHQGQTETRVFQMLEHAFFNIHELLSEGQASETGAGTLGILGGTWTTHRRLSLLGCLWMPPGGAACVRVLASVHGVEDGVEVGCVCARIRVRSGQEVQEDRTNVSEENWALGDLVQIPPVGLTSGTSGRSLEPREASVCSSVKWAGHTAVEDGPAGHPLRASASPHPSPLL